LISFLSRVGFAPVNASLLGPVVRVGWVLAITEFSIFQLIGLAIYILTGPFIAFFAILFRKALRANALNPAVKQDGPTAQKGRSAQFAVLSALAAWFLLYGASARPLPILLGISVTGVLLAMRLYAALSYAQPSEVAKNVEPGFWLKFALSSADTEAKKLKEGGFKTALEVHMARSMQELWRYFVARVLLFFRGGRGQKRAGLLVLFQYVGNFLLLGILAILFWALVIKFAVLPQATTFQAAFQSSASHVLPGLNSAQLSLPWGLTACMSATAWILFVVYAGPAASAFPSLQASYISKMSAYFKTLRSTLSVQNKLIRLLKLQEKKL
jgi:hypothetical protein